MPRLWLIWMAVLCLALPALADTIVLKNGRRIVAVRVVEEKDHVSYETAAGRLRLPRSIIARIERSAVPSTTDRAANLEITPPPLEINLSDADVAALAVRGGSVDREYISRLEAAAQGGNAAAINRVAVAHHAAAQLELKSGESEQAINHYRRALTFAPEQTGLLLQIAYLHLRRSEYTPALDYLERARRASPESPEVAKLAGWALYGQNRTEQAVEEWQRALRLRPDGQVEQALEKARQELNVETRYREGESRHFVLRYHGGAAPELAREVLRTLEEHFRTIEPELNFTPAEPIGVILYTNQAFADITRAPAWVGAINDGRIRVPVQGLSSMTAELSRVLRHELAHSFIQMKTGGKCPVWLNEGIAQWLEGQRSGEYAALLVTAYERKASVPLKVLEGSWMNLPDQMAGYSYSWSLGVVEYIIATSGMRDIERLLEQIAAGSSPEASCVSVLRMDYAELEQETVKYLRRTYLR